MSARGALQRKEVLICTARAVLPPVSSTGKQTSMASEIKFGTDGWRGIIADDFTFDNVRRVGNAMAHYVHKHEDAGKGLVVGYDTRFASQQAAEIISEVLAAAGIPVCLSDDYTPTPALSYAVKNLGTAGGVMITSSHNPFNWNGVKYKASYGGSGTPAIMRAIEAELDSPPAAAGSGGSVTIADFKTPYIEAIKAFADLDAIRKANFKFAIDVMYGAGRGVLKGIFTESGIRHLEIRGEASIPSPFRRTSPCSRRRWCMRTARPVWRPTATPTASARSPKTAASSIRTNVFP